MDGVFALAYIRLRRHKRRREMVLQNRRRMQNVRNLSDSLILDEEILRAIYPLSKKVVLDLIELLRPHLPEAFRKTSVSPERKVLCALNFFVQGSYQKSLGGESLLGLSQSSVSRYINEVTEALNAPTILGKWIPFPLTTQERMEVIQKNFRSSGFPDVIGFIDSTHVSIKAPHIDEHLYVNRKGYHSINVQIICDSDLRILNCVSRFPGSAPDSHVWRQSEVLKEMSTVWESGEHCWLLGDSGYPHQPWLHTPILNAVDGSPEAHYNQMHTRARYSVERCIRMLKNRFRCLIRHRVLDYSPGKAGRIVNACCVLHNMCVRDGVSSEGDMFVDDDPVPTPRPLSTESREIQREAQIVRGEIVTRLAQ